MIPKKFKQNQPRGRMNSFVPAEVPPVAEYNDTGEIINWKQPFVFVEPLCDALENGRMTLPVVGGTLSTPDGLAEVARTLAGAADTKTSGISNNFGDDAGALCFVSDVTNKVNNGILTDKTVYK